VNTALETASVHSKSVFMAQTFVADDKFGDVVACLAARGWARKTTTAAACDLAWRNLRQTDFEKTDADRYVNHLRHAQRLSHKATLAAALFDAGAAFYPRCYDLRRPAHCRRFLDDAARVAAAAALRLGGPGDATLAAALVEACAGRAFDGVASLLVNGDSVTTLAARGGGADPVGAAAALRAFDAQAEAMVHGAAGAWVLKPAGGSCGEGIVCSASLRDLLAAAERQRWRVVVQKYVERPLTPLGRKFDVRQWVLLSSLRPTLVLWGFTEAYARFARQTFALTDASLRDKFAHLCNHSVQKDAADDLIPGNMWSQAQLRAHLDDTHGAGSFETVVRPSIRKIAVAVAETAARLGVERVGRGFEWLGLDILVAEDLTCYLLEANVSPDVSHSTAVTAALAPPATEDALALLLDEGHARDADAPLAARRRSALCGDPPPQSDGPHWELWLRARAPAPAEQPPARLSDGRADAWWRAEFARLGQFAPPPPPPLDASSDEEL